MRTSQETVSGSFSDLAGEIDPRTWSKFTLSARRGYDDEVIKIVFLRRPESYTDAGVELTVDSPDPGFAATSMSRLSELIDLGKPRWSFVHRGAWPWIILAITLVILAALAKAILGKVGLPWSLVWSTVYWAIIGILGLALAPVARDLLARFLPPAEIRHNEAQQASGSRFILALLSLWVIPAVVTLVLSVII
ncbi:hypothetical protein CGZ91_11780 [Parenemella sanctibonifatiensis]|uniref:Uncharacterized protein n=2 Tax=Parenemella sanctibonifatiensis TaxID=2016505 RepID=A0A255EN53_9ACTN|nr:hypothetical protein CGZ91_11780 [Parenemella sanctibonifatiensis]